MAKNRRSGAERRSELLQQLYEQLPTMACQGLCADSCCSMWQTRTEQQHIKRHTGQTLPLLHVPPTPCPALSMLRRCSVYEHRPMICRVWGLAGSMRCNYGCQPEGGHITDQQAYELLAQVAELDGDLETAEMMRAPFRQDPEKVERFLRSLQKDRDLTWMTKAKRSGTQQILPGGRLAPVRRP